MVAGVLVFPLWALTASAWMPLLGLGIALNLLDGLTQLANWRESNNAMRFALGLLFTAGVFSTAFFILGGWLWPVVLKY